MRLDEIVSDIEYADSILSRSLGLMFRRNINENYAMVFKLDKTRSVTVHMLFVTFPIDIIFLDSNKKILALDTLKQWIGHSKAPENTKYIIEMHSDSIKKHRLYNKSSIEFEEKI